MRIRKVVVVAAAWGLSMIGVGPWAQGSQTPSVEPGRAIEVGRPFGEIITGENIGFQRVANLHDRSGQVTGRFMVRVDGVWKEAVTPMAVVR